MHLKWTSTNASSCAGNGNGFFTGGNTSGTDTTIIEPTAGNSITYTIICTGNGNSASDRITVTAREVSAPEPPTVTLEGRVAGSDWGVTGSMNIEAGEQVHLKWSSTDADNCTGSGNGFSTGSRTSGTDTSITEPSAGNSTTYTVECYGDGGSAEDSIRVTKEDTVIVAQAPTAYLQRKINNELWSYNDATISAGDQIQLRWRSVGASSCTGSGPGFSTNNQPNGTDTSITEPSAGNSTTYTVECDGDGGSADDSIRVTKEGTVTQQQAPTVTLERRVNNGSWRTDSVTINEDDQVSLRWSSDNADRCTGSGNGFGTNNQPNGTDSSINEPSAGNSITYTVTCYGDGGDSQDSITITTERESRSSSGGGGSSRPLCKLTVSDDSVLVGEIVTLRWDTTRARDITITDGFGNVMVTTKDRLSTDKVDLFDGRVDVKINGDATFILVAERGSRDRECSVDVKVKNAGVTILSERNQPPILLSQMPYTGFDAGPTLTTVFYLVLTLWGLFVAYVLVVKRGRSRLAVTAVNKIGDKLQTTVVESTTVATETPTETTPDRVVPDLNDLSANTYNPALQEYQNAWQEIEDRANSEKVLLSSEVIQALLDPKINPAKRMEMVDRLVKVSKETYPIEDGWLFINSQRANEINALNID